MLALLEVIGLAVIILVVIVAVAWAFGQIWQGDL